MLCQTLVVSSESLKLKLHLHQHDETMEVIHEDRLHSSRSIERELIHSLHARLQYTDFVLVLATDCKIAGITPSSVTRANLPRSGRHDSIRKYVSDVFGSTRLKSGVLADSKTVSRQL